MTVEELGVRGGFEGKIFSLADVVKLWVGYSLAEMRQLHKFASHTTSNST
jgi:hypothetical protein